MNRIHAIMAAACAAAFATVPAAAQQGAQQEKQPREQQKSSARSWDVSQLYRSTWSAQEMIDTEVRGRNGEDIGQVKDIIVQRNGSVGKVVVEVGGFLDIGDQHIGVPWKDVQIGPEMQWVQVPLREVESGAYSLFGRVPQGEDVAAARASWRVNELLGDYASLADVPRYGLVTDALFDKQGKLEAVIVHRPAGPWGAAGLYGYPYHGDAPGHAYELPFSTAEVRDLGRFDYVLFAERSELAGDDAGSAAGGGGQAR